MRRPRAGGCAKGRRRSRWRCRGRRGRRGSGAAQEADAAGDGEHQEDKRHSFHRESRQDACTTRTEGSTGAGEAAPRPPRSIEHDHKGRATRRAHRRKPGVHRLLGAAGDSHIPHDVHGRRILGDAHANGQAAGLQAEVAGGGIHEQLVGRRDDRMHVLPRLRLPLAERQHGRFVGGGEGVHHDIVVAGESAQRVGRHVDAAAPAFVLL